VSARVSLSRGELFVSAFLMLPCFAVGSWLLSICGFKAFNFDRVLDGFQGALVLAIVLSCTRAGQ
jgi:hypothetical protein